MVRTSYLPQVSGNETSMTFGSTRQCDCLSPGIADLPWRLCKIELGHVSPTERPSEVCRESKFSSSGGVVSLMQDVTVEME